jgi:hypothetical protein
MIDVYPFSGFGNVNPFPVPAPNETKDVPVSVLLAKWH